MKEFYMSKEDLLKNIEERVRCLDSILDDPNFKQNHLIIDAIKTLLICKQVIKDHGADEVSIF